MVKVKDWNGVSRGETHVVTADEQTAGAVVFEFVNKQYYYTGNFTITNGNPGDVYDPAVFNIDSSVKGYITLSNSTYTFTTGDVIQAVFSFAQNT